MAFNQPQHVDAGHSHFNDVQGNQIVYITNNFVTERVGRRLGPEANRALLGFGSNADRPNHPTTPQRLLSNAVRSGSLPRGIGAITISDADDGDDEATFHDSPRESARIFNEAEELGYRVLSFKDHSSRNRRPISPSDASEKNLQPATRSSKKPSRVSPKPKQTQTPAIRKSREPAGSTKKLESSNTTCTPSDRHAPGLLYLS
ncbi:hypothetical protein FIBSPDRAFT_135897 [Athelia psychrophila]|uniref:Uncharacterized protein n=1 Tax=Athelia psychrophila TaxID=1759441 RepID=A0A166C7R2_9AGAM|nr:hypothetical protein FIBSPDRAFT_135897 [Fibularhizoctonia sp. CBS 109695]